MGKSKNEAAWELLFNEYDILNKIKKNGVFTLSAKQINKYREARLMTKFDHSTNLPDLFKKLNLNILPITRGDYIIGEFEAYNKINYYNFKPKLIDFPSEVSTIDYKDLYSEASAVNCSFVTGMIDDILGEKCLPTVNGRMVTSMFEFNILNKDNHSTTGIVVNNSQIEIDGGFESKNYFCILEAKNYMVDDFIIRQLYYPYRLWKSKIIKKVIPVFFTFSNNIFSFFIYDFESENNYNSIKLIEQKNYTLVSDKISTSDLINLINSTNIISEPKIPFPQADTFERILDLLFLLKNQNLTLEDITYNYSFDKRQAAYYSSALMYLRLAIRKNEMGIAVYSLSDEGKDIISLEPRKRNLSIVKRIIEHEVFNILLRNYLQTFQLPQKGYIIEIMQNSNSFNVDKNSSTLTRRAQTVQTWFNWLISLIQ